MTQEELVSQTREKILSMLREIKRPGIDKVIWYLENSTYFRAQCNTHHKFHGGLAVHSLGVYKEFKKLSTSFPEDTICVVSLLHDICKTRLHGYNHIGLGHNGRLLHGLRSALLLDALGLQFNEGERDAIINHMHSVGSIPSTATYEYREMLQHYIHSSDHRDAPTYPDGFDSYTPDEKKHRWYRIDTLLYSTKRSGIEIVIDHLHGKNCLGKRDVFYNAPASVRYHNNTKGGLAKHSMDVYQEAKTMYEDLISKGEKLPFGMDSIILCSLLHDVCKMDEYVMKDGRPEDTKHYNGGNPQGMKSESCLRRWHLDLTNEERKAIIWQMEVYAKDAMAEYSTAYDEVASGSQLVHVIHEADGRAANNDV